jgi:hypothetical protein
MDLRIDAAVGGKVCVQQVTDCSQHTMQIRALMDARNSSDAWELRCLVRERLIDFLQKDDPQSLPRVRGEFDQPGSQRILAEGENDLGRFGSKRADEMRTRARV